jgi:AraC-like DNA-binding protein
MMEGVRFGPWSIALLIFAGQALVLAAALIARRADRSANLYLAALLIVIAGMLTPFVIGYAGFYDAFPWLSFAPFAVPLAVGPLLYGHVHATVRGSGIGWLHVILPGLQFTWQAGWFLQPLAAKEWADSAIQEPFLNDATSIAVIASMAGYGVASLRLLRGARSGGRRDAAIKRLRLAVGAVLVLVAARAGFDLYDALIARLDYFDLFAFYLLLSCVAMVLGVEGWRGASEPLPSFARPAERDWAALARDWDAQLRREGWWRDPELDAARLARRIGTNTSYLSRALNEGLGLSFADWLGAIRAEAVAARIEAGASDDLLSLALEAGFGSKASFNRAFARRFGQSPSAYRRASTAEKQAAAAI